MANKIICCSFEPGSMGGFITICNGVKHSRPEHFSKTIAVTKEAFCAACKDRVLFNDILGIDVRSGWQNALGVAIEPYKSMKEVFDPKIATDISSELDVKIRGEEAVQADIEAVEKENAEIEKKVENKRKKATKKEVKDEQGTTEEPDSSRKDAGSENDSGLSAEQSSADSVK